ncbi:MAG: hypothetical protein IT546_04195 [Caulobacteraceae bacterium]|nr:hypothetical protein [Caulobacteraceae bacterium]
MSAAGRVPVLAAAIAAAVATALFGVTAGFALLSVNAPLWLNPPNDTGVAAMGYLAFLHEPWRFPPTVTRNLIAPLGLSIVYTDSIPLFALALKALGLGQRLHLLGVFMLVSWVLQPLGMLALLRACGVRRLASLLLGCGVALFYPAWLLMFTGHISLAGHWLLTFALAASIGAAREGLNGARIVAFAALAAVAAGVHIYHLVPVAACFGAALLAELLQRGRASAVRLAAAVGAVAAATALSAWVFGYGIGRQFSGGGEALGFFSMNLLGPVMPQGSALFGQRLVEGRFEGAIDPNGGQWYEGYNYLGAGVLALIAIAAWLLVRERSGRSFDARRFGPLVLALVALTLIAVGPRPYLGPWLVADMGRPSGVIGDWLGYFRCHGRFFWTVGYALIAWAVVQLDRRLGAAALALAAVAIVGLQVFDTAGLQQAVRQVYDRRPTDLYPAGFRAAPTLQGRDWRIYPSFSCTPRRDFQAWAAQLSFLALLREGSTKSAPTARLPVGMSCEPEAADLTTAPAGSRRLTVLLPEAAVTARFVGRKDCYLFAGGYLCGAGLDGLDGLTPIDASWRFGRFERVRTIALDLGARPPELGAGWSIPEPGGFWSDGPRATILAPAADFKAADRLWLEISAAGYPPGKTQVVEVWSGGVQRATWAVESKGGVYRAAIPRPADMAAGAEVELRFAAPGRPSDLDPQSPDHRLLGIAVSRISLYPDAGAGPR